MYYGVLRGKNKNTFKIETHIPSCNFTSNVCTNFTFGRTLTLSRQSEAVEGREPRKVAVAQHKFVFKMISTIHKMCHSESYSKTTPLGDIRFVFDLQFEHHLEKFKVRHFVVVFSVCSCMLYQKNDTIVAWCFWYIIVISIMI